jgi:hypothetical protein
VYICVDSRGEANANWMNSYKATGLTINTTDNPLIVNKRNTGPGEISFGGNHDAGNLGALSNYIVVIIPGQHAPINKKYIAKCNMNSNMKIIPLWNGNTTVTLSNEIEIYEVAVYDISGKLMLSAHGRSRNKVVLQTKSLSKGMYIIRGSTGNSFISRMLLQVNQ